MNSCFKIYFLLVLSVLSIHSVLIGQKKYTLSSPGKNIDIAIAVGDAVSYTVSLDQKEVIGATGISFTTDAVKTTGWKVSKAKQTSANESLTPVVPQKSSIVKDIYNQLRIDFANGLSVEFRAYDNGIAWRWITSYKTPYKVVNEETTFGFDKQTKIFYPQEDNFYSHNEREYKKYVLDSIGEKLASLPVLFDAGGTKIVLTESDLFNYAGMWLRGNGKGQVRSVFPNYPKEKKLSSDRDEKVVSREDFIAAVDGPQSFPWRILMIAKEDKDIISNQLVYQLGRASVGDYSWIRPGKVQWDWWHYNNIYGVDFRAGINNDTYKYYIDFASKYNIEYVLLDEGWCDTRDLFKQAPGINVEELANYARAKNVSLLLWTSWLVLDKQLDAALDKFAQWGIKGIKVDFMQRDDQLMVNYYDKIAKAAAARKMMVDFHGAYKPTGWMRSHPNIMTSEGVLGNEISKFAGSITPEHTTVLPFTRMAAGPMDFTPGGMLNVQKNAFAAVGGEPMTLGTRCNQLAMYVVYESPLQMLCDIPTHYYREPEAMEFLKVVPTVWKNTVPLEGKTGDYIAIAREALNGDWYIGAMTDWTARDLTVSFNFLPEGNYTMQVWKDGVNADRNARDFKMETIKVTRSSTIMINMAKGGGYVGRIVKM